ncbi:insulinase family protein, partial [bacterium]|nr:insulinase family protein [bacterium]
MDPRNPNIQSGDLLNGFSVKHIENIDSLKIVFYELEHRKTGSRMIHLSSDDDNCVFMVTLATHPEDSTGVAHILEHGVLEGSKNYPVRIFKNLSGRSLNTFLNAMTSSDYTAYPFASRNKTDFFNIMDLYIDAVFFPLLSKHTFLQEGWRYEFARMDDPETPLEYKGVVFNEMKGAMSNPVRLFHEYFQKGLFPDLTYAMASGGDPKHIPELTYKQWNEFHKKFYHPSNAFFFTHGNIPLTELTARIDDKVLSKFKKESPTKPIPRQTNFKSPRTVKYTFPISKSEDTKNKAFVALVWKLIPITNFYENLKLSVLDTILSGSSSSVLNRTLMKSGLGSGLA